MAIRSFITSGQLGSSALPTLHANSHVRLIPIVVNDFLASAIGVSPISIPHM